MLNKDEEWTSHNGELRIRTSNTNMLGVDRPKDEKLRKPTDLELERVISYLSEQGSFAVTIYCRNEACRDNGSWIRRSKEDATKGVFCCESCMQPMGR
jgi:hypothetical protein